MDITLEEHICNNLNTRPTAELVAIWEENDRTEWSNEAFEAIQEILLARIGSLPPQKPRVDAPDGEVKTPTKKDTTTAGLLGGLTLIPYGLYALLSALSFAQGWLDWQTNQGPPVLGLVAAWLVERAIKRYYRKTYDTSFDEGSTAGKRTTFLEYFGVVLIALSLLVAWFLDARVHPSVRALPVVMGLLMIGYGVGWLRRKEWPQYGLLQIVIGCLAIGLGLTPLIINVPSSSSYFGLDGILELTLGGFAIILIGVMEHWIFLKRRETMWKADFYNDVQSPTPNP